jgi:hypothetical protein
MSQVRCDSSTELITIWHLSQYTLTGKRSLVSECEDLTADNLQDLMPVHTYVAHWLSFLLLTILLVFCRWVKKRIMQVRAVANLFIFTLINTQNSIVWVIRDYNSVSSSKPP